MTNRSRSLDWKGESSFRTITIFRDSSRQPLHWENADTETRNKHRIQLDNPKRSFIWGKDQLGTVTRSGSGRIADPLDMVTDHCKGAWEADRVRDDEDAAT